MANAKDSMAGLVGGFDARAASKRVDALASQAHCVFRRGSCWFALPVESVREVMFRPAIVPVPHAGAVLAGLCHVRTEFIPVLRIHILLVDDHSSLPPEKQLLVIAGSDGPWGLLVDQVVALELLEASLSSDSAPQDALAGIVAGWATFREQVVRVLDPARFYRFAKRMLEESCLNGAQTTAKAGWNLASSHPGRHGEAAETTAREIT